MFPFTILGKVRIKTNRPVTIAVMRDEISSNLTSEQATDVFIQDNSIDFNVGLFRPLGWKVLAGMSSGNVRVGLQDGSAYVDYEIRFFNLVIWVTILIIMAMGLEALLSTKSTQVLFFIVGWLWLVGGNVLITNWKFRRFVKRCVKEAIQHNS